MNITKLGHCCLVLEINGQKVLTDPGTFTLEPVKAVTGVNIILITHEHADHFHIESIQEVLLNNPGAIVVSNAAVAKLLSEKSILCTVVGDGQSTEIAGVLIEGFGKDHAPIYATIGLVENTGYMVGSKFYLPGDSYFAPGKSVDVLALPTAGPWTKISESIDFAKKVKPRMAFPVHDGMIIPNGNGFASKIMESVFAPEGITFVTLEAGEKKEF